MKLWILIGVMICSFLLIGITDVYACSCDLPGSPAEEIKNSDVVFIGVMTGDVVYPYSGGSNDIEDAFIQSMVHTTFTVDKRIKGPTSTKIIVVESSDSGSSCGIGFMSGVQYVIYGSYSRHSTYAVTTSLCSRSGPIFTDLENLSFTTTKKDLEYFASLNRYDYLQHKIQSVIDMKVGSVRYSYVIVVMMGLLALIGGVYLMYQKK